ncbi:MAG TPA: trifunctional transcriptional regulator/proline dehydrogenase/L-glutamate gamma-semialdehyde dehydrogenase [Beijerinckiaceae bacterium]|nr:trifunctional transcriptional regulator/proline dehydrogenase/L-glutamate gamma-semialdehyde dehydrogenase [Beijerinckiaceae bacterium]
MSAASGPYLPQHDGAHSVFADFAPAVRPLTPLRQAIVARYRLAEPDLLPGLIQAATLPEAVTAKAQSTARKLVEGLRAMPRGGGVEGLVQEFSLSSQEGVALMCLAEALLRIPDNETRDALIRDKIATGDWSSHLGTGKSLFVNAATWGLVVTGKLTATVPEGGLAGALTRIIGRLGEPIIRRGVDLAMRLMGEQFVTGQTIEEALETARVREAQGFSYSFDMLGEAATTAEDAKRYLEAYVGAVHAIGVASAGRGPYAGPGISVKLSALHPRYSRSQAHRVMAELLPRLTHLARLAKSYDIGFNIDAEEADRLDLSLDLLQSLCEDHELAGWNGLGFVVQAYGKRCPAVIDFLVDLARANKRRLMVRLVKGAYWDAEIKRAQVDGLSDYPVFTRKIYTDVSYIACARKLLAAKDAVFAQFATHNAHSLATIHAMAGEDFKLGDFEFQCLHGMGEPLYEQVVGTDKLNRPCRIYAPVGTHETLLAYLVRRLLENGANSSFVNRIGDPEVPVDALIADPVAEARAMKTVGAPHKAILAPVNLFLNRANSRGLDPSNEVVLARLGEAMAKRAKTRYAAGPMLAVPSTAKAKRPVRNPGDHRDEVGTVIDASEADVAAAVARAGAAFRSWSDTDIADRATALEQAADRMESHYADLLPLIMREAGKTLANAIAEVRESVDFLRFYGGFARSGLKPGASGLGPVACISPWNFPLAIFTGQVAAALVAGNPVLAKPAEETPLVAAAAVRLLHESGVPKDVLQLLPGDGRIGAALVSQPGVHGVMFTGSTEVARRIQAVLSGRLLSDHRSVPLIAETGGLNAMVVDSSALAEQVVQDVLASAFDSAGQRCSALRILCLQEEIADRTLTMLKGAMDELSIGRTDRLSIDIGPVITGEARSMIEAHVSAMAGRGFAVHRLHLSQESAHGTYVAPTLIEVDSVRDVEREVFGPVLHVVRFARADLAKLIKDINASGYGLTFGLHTRIDETIAEVRGSIKAGNIYVNRNIIGAVVGVQPFGGEGLSGTGPKAGGPLYLSRLLDAPDQFDPGLPRKAGTEAAKVFASWLLSAGLHDLADRAEALAARARVGLEMDLPGPVGEKNLYQLKPRGACLLSPVTKIGLYQQIATVLAAGCSGIIDMSDINPDFLLDLPVVVTKRLRPAARAFSASVDAALVEGDANRAARYVDHFAKLPGRIVPVQTLSSEALEAGTRSYAVEGLLEETSTSINTAAAGGNASLMTLDINP